MKRALIFILFSISTLFCMSQKTEELETLWNNHFRLAQQSLKEQKTQQAEEHLITCKQLLYDNDASQSIYFFQTLSLLAEVYMLSENTTQLERAKSDYIQLKQYIRPTSKKMVHYLFYGARLHSSTMNYRQAITYAQEALACTDAVSTIDGMRSKLYHQIAFCYYKTQQLDLAIENARMAIHHDDNQTLIYLKALLHYLYLAKQWDEFEQVLPQCYTDSRESVLRHFSQSKANQRNLFWSQSGQFFSTFIPNYTFSHPSNILTSYAYDATLFSKGILLAATNKSADLLLNSQDTDMVKMYHRYLNLKSSKKRTIDQDFELEALEDVIVRYQHEHKYDFRKDFRCTWKMVQEQLQEQEAAIEFIAFPTDNEEIQYAALVLTKNAEHPIFIPLLTANQLNAIPSENHYITPDLYNLVWLPLEDILSEMRTIYFSPSGIFHKIGIEYIPNDFGFNMSMSHQMYRLSSTRELILSYPKLNKDVALFGGIDYDTPVDILANESSTSTQYYENRNYSTIHTGDSNIGFKYLPGTLHEVKTISDQYTTKDKNILLYTQQDASEAQLKKCSTIDISTLHIATHGFFYAPQRIEKPLSTSLLFDLTYNNYQEINPLDEDKMLTRSGLILSGANNRLRKINIPDGVEDGILFADEIASMNLSNIDLVVLSACESGLGNVESSEGVFGLQRGFKIAGANSLIMSLWKVDDTATRILMTRFHENLLAGQSKIEAFQNAQLALRTCENNKYDNYTYWAAFVLLDGLN